MRPWSSVDGSRAVWVFLICCLLAYATYNVKVTGSTSWTNGSLEYVHKQLTAFDYVNNEQSRVLQWGIPQLLVHATGIEVRHAYALQRLVFTTLALFVFHGFVLRWLRPGAALASIALYAVFIDFSAQNDLQESAPLLGLTYCAGLWALRDRKDLIFAALVWIGSLNNETTLFLIPLYVLVHWEGQTWWRMAIRALLLGLPALLTVGIIRYLTRDLAYLGGGWHPAENLRSFGRVLVFFGPFWILAVWHFRALPRFLQRCAVAIPLFLLPNMLIGIITETRLLLPLTFTLIPAALWTMWPDERAPGAPIPS